MVRGDQARHLFNTMVSALSATCACGQRGGPSRGKPSRREGMVFNDCACGTPAQEAAVVPLLCLVTLVF